MTAFNFLDSQFYGYLLSIQWVCSKFYLSNLQYRAYTWIANRNLNTLKAVVKQSDYGEVNVIPQSTETCGYSMIRKKKMPNTY